MANININNLQAWLDKQDSADHGKDKVTWLNTLKLTRHIEKDGDRVLIPEDQIRATHEAFSLVTLNADNQTSIPTNFNTAGQMVQFKVTGNTIGFATDMNLKWTLTASTADVIMPPPMFWVNRIEFWGNGVNGKKFLNVLLNV